MISPEALFNSLKTRGTGIFTGVPDSLLASFCDYVNDHANHGEHIIAANEGNAIALACGYHLSTGKIGVVYLQNSGLGNTINPLTSLADSEVYSMPLLMIIGWRGEPGVKDEPQHIKQGRITPRQLELLEIPFWVLDSDSDPELLLDNAFDALHKTSSPVALLIKKNTFHEYSSQRAQDHRYSLQRENALSLILSATKADDLIVSTTGKTSREVFDLRAERKETQHDFLTVGGMGHASSIALGVALGQPKRRVLCLDGDGAMLMHMGAIPIIGDIKPGNFVHVLLNNAAHESVGGQPTIAGKIDCAAIVKACGYHMYFCAEDEVGLKHCLAKIEHVTGPVFLEIKIRTGARKNLGRPTRTPLQNKNAFMGHIRG